MNRKREEELMQLAFGDLRREDCGSFASQIDSDPEAEKMYGAYCEMREGLKALRDIPEMQLSTERLRDAILREGLTPRQTPRWSWNWLAMPIAVGACAFVVVTAMKKQDPVLPGAGSGGLVVKNLGTSPDSVVSLGGSERIREDLFNVGPFDFGDSVSESTPAPSSPATSKNVKGSIFSKRRGDAKPSGRSASGDQVRTRAVPGLAMALAAQPTTPTLDEREVAVMTAAPAAMSDHAMVENPFKSTGNNEIVQIDSRVDAETGAARAVEVKGTQNVEIGG